MQYGLIVRRLEAYRKQNHMSQTALAKELNMTQSQYSKLELGKVKLSYEVMQRLYEHGWDIDMIITGESSVHVLPNLADVFREDDITQYVSGMKLCEWAMERWRQNERKEEAIGKRLLKIFLSSQEGTTPFQKLRQALGMSQVKMAETVGVNIKKYRALEKRELEPDAELMANIYEATGCKPGYFFDERNFYLTVVSEECAYSKRREEQLADLLSVKEKFEQENEKECIDC